MRVALVTGGTSGIGAAIADALKAAGHRVVATFRSDQGAADAFRSRTGIDCYRWDVADADACLAGVARVEAEVGPIDILVNNAGITRDAMLHRMTVEQWRDVMSVNLDGCFHMCRAVIDGMRLRNYGRIVNIASVNGQTGQLGQTNYAASKAGLIGFTKALALESARRHITVNVVAPGYIDTPMTQVLGPSVLQGITETIPLRKLGDPADVARAVAFLVADEASYITGSTLSVNGGRCMT